MKITERGYDENSSKNKNIQLCIHYFHPRMIEHDVSNNITLKVGASPTILLTPFSRNNDNFKEDSELPRLVGSAKYFQTVQDYQRNNEKTDQNVFVLVPARQCQISKRLNNMDQPEMSRKN